MSILANLQQSVIERLTATVPDIPSLVPKNGAITWVAEEKDDLSNIIARAVAKVGIVGIVLTPGGRKLFRMRIYPIPFLCPLHIQIQENVIVNRGAAGTGIANLDLVEFCMKRLHLWSPTNQRITRIEVDETPYIMVSEAPILAYNVMFFAKITIV